MGVNSETFWDDDDFCERCECYTCICSKEETNMTIDFTKPVYIATCFDACGLTNDLDAAIKKAAQSAKSDRDGDDYLILKAIKRVSTPRPEATITDLVA